MIGLRVLLPWCAKACHVFRCVEQDAGIIYEKVGIENHA
jgi:hypothetical protein